MSYNNRLIKWFLISFPESRILNLNNFLVKRENDNVLHFLTFAQNINCGHYLEPWVLKFTLIKSMFKTRKTEKYKIY